MMDYVELVKHIRYTFSAMERPCIVVGGSYGGMLAAWLRIKFPATFQGALASSAPLVYFPGAPSANETRFGDLISESFKNVSDECFDTIKEGFSLLINQTDKVDNYKDIEALFNVCENTPIKNSTSIWNLYYHLMNGYSYMAMTNYPYETTFLMHMPGCPVNVACKFFKDFPDPKPSSNTNRQVGGSLNDTTKSIFKAIYNSTSVYFNHDKKEGFCTDISDTEATGELDGEGWNVLACN